MTIYIDLVFVENLILNFIILYATGIIGKEKIKLLRTALGSIIGSAFVILTYFIRLKLVDNFVLKIVLSIIMVYITFSPKTPKDMLKMFVLFYLTSFVFGGAALGVIYMVNPSKITIQNGVIAGNYTIRTILIGIIIAFVILIIGFKTVKAKFSKKDLFCKIYLELNQKQIEMKAMLDTGNLLKEPITNIPVIVVEHNQLESVIPKEILDNIENILGGDFSNIPENIKNEYMSKLKIIPFSSLGKQNGMLLGIKADGLKIEEENNVKNVDKVIIGIYNKKLSKNKEYHALLGFDMI